DAFRLGRFAGAFNRRTVVVEAGEPGVRIGLGHHDGGGAVAAAHVGDAGARLQLRLDAVQRGDPSAAQVGVVTGAEEPLGAAEEAGAALLPAQAAPAPERAGPLRPPPA